METKCPCCNGTGSVNRNKLIDRAKRRQLARKMRTTGATYMKIMVALGYRSPRSVQLALERND